MFHHFHGRAHPRGQGSISDVDFERIIQAVGPERILSPSEWLARLDAESLRDADVCLTFDDGLLSQYEVALPVMQRYGLQAFWFVYSSVFEGGIGRFEVYRVFRHRCFASLDAFYDAFFAAAVTKCGVDVTAAVTQAQVVAIRADYPFYSVSDVRFRLLRDRVLGPLRFEDIMDGMMADHQVTAADLSDGLWMSDAHLFELAQAGHHVGLHTYSHPMSLAEMNDDEQRQEYQRNLRHLHRVCGTSPQAVAHPVNSYSRTTLEILIDLGIRCGFRANRAPGRLGESINASFLELPREDHANIIARLDTMEECSE